MLQNYAHDEYFDGKGMAQELLKMDVDEMELNSNSLILSLDLLLRENLASINIS